MTPERWARAQKIFEAVFELPEDQRAAYLDTACQGDPGLRAEIEQMLAGSAESTLRSPIANLRPTDLAPGDTVAHYRIEGKLGEGGMGVVYKARDSRLKRMVALKVLPPEKVTDPERKRRFIQEARAASALSHPNIVTVYDIDQADGVDFIAMEHVEGKTLDKWIGRKGLKLAEVLKYAIQIADALAKAHAAGIVHRDLKPANVMVTPDGRVKVLDFGLAKLTETAPAGPEDLTQTQQASTELGLILGTVSYMSPEQAEGKKVDARSDIFSFGSMLYEMLTGKPPFRRDTAPLTLAAVLNLEPPPLPAEVPSDLNKIVTRCLRKDVARRYQHMDDVKVVLEELKEESDSGKLAAIPAGGRNRARLWLGAAGVAGLLLLAVVVAWRLREGTPPSGLRAVALTSYSGIEQNPSLSPDGSKVAFAWNGEKEDNFDIYVKQIGGSGTPVRLTTDPAPDNYPAWSPDDRWIAFERVEKGKVAILLMPSVGGPERRLTDLASTIPLWLSWTPDAKWLLFSDQEAPPQKPLSIWAIHVETGERRRLTTFVTQSAGGQFPLGDCDPSISPDGATLAFARQSTDFVWDLFVQRLTRDLRPAGDPARITNQYYGGMYGTSWTADGREIVYSAGGASVNSLWRVPVSGSRAPERLAYALPSAQALTISHSPPRLVYTWQFASQNLWRLDIRTGERKMFIGSTYLQSGAQYSPDGRKIAFQSSRSGSMEIWTCDADGSNCQQITFFDGPACGTPRWSPDGRWLALDSRAEGLSQIYVVAADGGKPRRITNHRSGSMIPGWSHDGNWIYFASERSAEFQVWKTPTGGGEPVQVTRTGGFAAFESLDGKYLYYSKQSQLGLYRMPAQGGEETQVVQASPAAAIFSFGVTSKGLYFMPDPKTIQFLDTATGKIRTVAALDKPIGALCVSPDDAYVVYSQMDRNSVDLMLVEGFR